MWYYCFLCGNWQGPLLIQTPNSCPKTPYPTIQCAPGVIRDQDMKSNILNCIWNKLCLSSTSLKDNSFNEVFFFRQKKNFIERQFWAWSVYIVQTPWEIGSLELSSSADVVHTDSYEREHQRVISSVASEDDVPSAVTTIKMPWTWIRVFLQHSALRYGLFFWELVLVPVECSVCIKLLLLNKRKKKNICCGLGWMPVPHEHRMLSIIERAVHVVGLQLKL